VKLPPLLAALALAFLLWELVAVVLWARESGGLRAAPAHFWRSLHSDWMVLLVVTDHLVVAGAVLVGLWLDAARAGASAARRVGLAIAFIALGSPAMLLYLAWRLPVLAGEGPSGES
jgi:hypothetical protein